MNAPPGMRQRPGQATQGAENVSTATSSTGPSVDVDSDACSQHVHRVPWPERRRVCRQINRASWMECGSRSHTWTPQSFGLEPDELTRERDRLRAAGWSIAEIGAVLDLRMVTA